MLILSATVFAESSAEDWINSGVGQATAKHPSLAELVEGSSFSDGLISGPDHRNESIENSVPNDEIGALKKRLEDLEKTVQSLEKNDGGSDPKFLKPEKTDKSLSADKWDIRLGGHVQLDYVDWANADPSIDDTLNYFNYRRLRLVADGIGYEQFDFRLQMTLEPGLGSTDNITASPDVKDAYLSMNEIPVLGRVRAGNFFVPFSLEQVTNDTNNVFLERSIPTEGIFAASREVGVAIYNCTDDEQVTWSGGVFFEDINDTEKTRFDDNQGTRLAGRLTWLPYYDNASEGLSLIHTGVGVLHTKAHDDHVRFRSRPQVQRGPVLIDSGVLNADSCTTSNLELAIVYGALTIQTEAFVSEVQNLAGDTSQIDGMYAHASYFLTQESRIFEPFGQHGAQFGRTRPHRNFKFSQAGSSPGAWELKARWSNLDLDKIRSGQYNDLIAGVNWYWSDRTRWMFDWIHPITTQDAVFGETKSDLLALRLDFNW
jgi:phosphate-selective porin OprO and OprP